MFAVREAGEENVCEVQHKDHGLMRRNKFGIDLDHRAGPGKWKTKANCWSWKFAFGRFEREKAFASRR